MQGMQRVQPGINWEPEIVAKIKKNQRSDLESFKVIDHISKRLDFKLIGNVLHYQDRLCAGRAGLEG